MAQSATSAIDALLKVMADLRTPGSGCPWDLEQTFETIAPYTIEEAYEVADAIARSDIVELKEELGDLLLQVVYHARIGEEAGDFTFQDVTNGITQKMIRRHPHVFGDDSVANADAMRVRWDDIKAEEKRAKEAARAAVGETRDAAAPSVLDGVALALPALTRALKLQKKAARVGFDWDDPRAVIAKIREELDEVEEALDEGDRAHVREEVGDLLFVMTNLARHIDVDAEQALKDANAKFSRRFAFIERTLTKRGASPEEASLNEMEALWAEAKAAE